MHAHAAHALPRRIYNDALMTYMREFHIDDADDIFAYALDITFTM